MALRIVIACLVSALGLLAAAAPYKSGLRYLTNPLGSNDTDHENLPIWYPILSSNTSPAWNFSGDYPSGIYRLY